MPPLDGSPLHLERLPASYNSHSYTTVPDAIMRRAFDAPHCTGIDEATTGNCDKRTKRVTISLLVTLLFSLLRILFAAAGALAVFLRLGGDYEVGNGADDYHKNDYKGGGAGAAAFDSLPHGEEFLGVIAPVVF